MDDRTTTRVNSKWPDYDSLIDTCKDFLMEFTPFLSNRRKYQLLLLNIANREGDRQLVIEMEDFQEWADRSVESNGVSTVTEELKKECFSYMQHNTQRFVDIFSEAVDSLLETAILPTVDLNDKRDIIDVLRDSNEALRRDLRREIEEMKEEMNVDNDDNNNNNNNGNGGQNEENQRIGPPKSLQRRYEIRILPCSNIEPLSIRDVKASDIGTLVKIKGMVTRVTDVKPLMTVACYMCETCMSEAYIELNDQSSYTPIDSCPNVTVDNGGENNNGGGAIIKCVGKMRQQLRGCKFVKYQEIKLQELPDQVPMGHIPRSMTVHCKGEIVRQALPGDIITVSGLFLPHRYKGIKALRAGLISDTYLEAQGVEKHKKSYSEYMEVDDEMDRQMDDLAEESNLFDILAASIAPEIYGHLDVKKALLLQLVGGVTKDLPDGMKIRGDINVILMGDPGVAKSQLIKYMARVAPRGVYTTGKGSSGVGLTAAVIRDSITGELALEGGALVMADKGLCCIDEFDKMDENDRTAIHEVMEQQTVSIAKAGIATTLNARCSVLAAANPLYGRYNLRKSMSENINLPNSLLSRFDLVFLLLDKPNLELDLKLARHVAHVHRFLKRPDIDPINANEGIGSGNTEVYRTYDENFIKHYIAQARAVEPYVPTELVPYIVEAYVTMREDQQNQNGIYSRTNSNRNNDHSGRGYYASSAIGMQNSLKRSSNNDQTQMTARQLLSILRLSQALARLRFTDNVDESDVDEAIRLTHASKLGLLEDEEKNVNADSTDLNSRIYNVIREYAERTQAHTLRYDQIETMLVKKGFRPDQVQNCLQDYQDLNVLQISSDQRSIELFR